MYIGKDLPIKKDKVITIEEAIELCKKKKIKFECSIFDEETIELCKKLNLNLIE
jgi:hypothetical protein